MLGRIAILACFLFSPLLAAYDVTDRFVLLEDKFKTEEMLRPYGHDFLLDVNAYVNKNLFDVIDETDVIIKTQDSTEKLNKAQEFLQKYDKTEQTVRAKIGIGIPIFSFHVGGWKIEPNLRVMGEVGANLGIRSESLTSNLVAELLEDDLPADILTQIRNTDISVLLSGSKTVGQFLTDDVGVDPTIVAALPTNVTSTSLPNNQDVPNLAIYSKADIRAGFFTDFSKTRNFGFFNLYGMGRVDLLAKFDANQLTSDEIDLFGGGEEVNTQVFLMSDVGYGRLIGERYRIRGSIEDLKIARLSENLDKGGPLLYSPKPLFRVHGEARWSLGALSVTPFVGAHRRSQYGFDDGIYIGTDLGAHVWGERIGLTFRTMLDKEHITFSPMMKLWLLRLQYSLKQPVKSTVDDVKTSAIHSLNFRLFF